MNGKSCLFWSKKWKRIRSKSSYIIIIINVNFFCYHLISMTDPLVLGKRMFGNFRLTCTNS